MYVGRGDFEQEEWKVIRLKEKKRYEEIKHEFIAAVKNELYEWRTNFRFEFNLSKKIRAEYNAYFVKKDGANNVD